MTQQEFDNTEFRKGMKCIFIETRTKPIKRIPGKIIGVDFDRPYILVEIMLDGTMFKVAKCIENIEIVK